MARPDRTPIDLLCAILDQPEALREQARDLGVVRRQGKVDAYALLVVVVLGVAVRGPTAIAQLGQVLAEVTGVRLARSSFWDRFTPAFARLLRSVLGQVVKQARSDAPSPPGALSGFKDVIAVDATVVKVHDALASTWRGTRRSSASAALKVHAWVRGHRDRSRKAVGRPLRKVLEGLERALLDLQRTFRGRIRRYDTPKGRFVSEQFRVVAVRNPKTRTYEVFITNAPTHLLPAEYVAATYRLRWEVETFFKTSKSGSGLDDLPSSKREIVEALLYASLLRATVSMQALARFRREVADSFGRLVNPGQWHKWWRRQVHLLAAQLVDAESALDESEVAHLLSDPNLGRITNRERFRLVGYAA